MMSKTPFLMLSLMLAACSARDLPPTARTAQVTGDFPELLPLDEVLGTTNTRLDETSAEALEARANGLRRRTGAR